jgi:hypothetical protein
MQIMSIPSPRKALMAARFVLEHVGVADAIILQSILFEADVLHVDQYGRQIYGECWDVSWQGPRPALLSAILNREADALSLLEDRDARTIRDIGHSVDGATITMGLSIERIMSMNSRYRLESTPADLLSVSDEECMTAAIENSADTAEAALERLCRHPALSRCDGVRVRMRDMLDPKRDDHEGRMRRIEEDEPYTAY